MNRARFAPCLIAACLSAAACDKPGSDASGAPSASAPPSARDLACQVKRDAVKTTWVAARGALNALSKTIKSWGNDQQTLLLVGQLDLATADAVAAATPVDAGDAERTTARAAESFRIAESQYDMFLPAQKSAAITRDMDKAHSAVEAAKDAAYVFATGCRPQ